MKRPLIPDQRAAVAGGLALVAAGFACLYDAWDGRGQRKPWWLGWLLPW